MDQFERTLDNLDVLDKHNLKNVLVGNSLVYNGNVIDITHKKFELETKRKRPLAAAVVGLANTAVPLPYNVPFYDPNVDTDALELFLRSNPTCYLILGKPGSEAFSLGEAISKKLNCIHLCPKTMIAEEIEQKSSTGICLDHNMKQNKICDFEILLKILKVKLNAAVVKHRGYIISGFPIVTASMSPKYLISRYNGEESIQVIQELLFDLLCNLKKKKHRKKKTDTGSADSEDDALEEGEVEEEEEEEQEPEENLEEEEEIKCELPKSLMDSCSDLIIPRHAYFKTRKAVLLEQINSLFNLEMKPNIVIYLTGSDKDLVTKKKNKYINYKNSKNITEPFINKIPTDLRWPTKYKICDIKSYANVHNFNSKYCCRQPVNFEMNSNNQMCNYRNEILPYIESKLKEFKLNFIIKLDATQPVDQMMLHIMERLLLLPVKPVIIPAPLYLEEPPEEMEEFWKFVEEFNVIHSGELSFKRYASLWYNRCPVELKYRQSKKGKTKLAVTFTKHVYLLSTLDAMVSFCKNPRPYLKLQYLEPPCRIIVTGTKSSGKTMISQCLSWLFDAPMISYDNFEKVERDKKYNSYARTILSEIIPTIEDQRLAVWQSAETKRLHELETWYKHTMPLVKTYIPLLIESFTYIKKETSEESLLSFVNEEEEVIHTKTEELEPSPEFVNKFESLKTQLAFLPNLDDVDWCQNLLTDKTTFLSYAPPIITTPIPKPKVPILEDEDVTIAINKYIIANELQKEIEPTTEEFMTEIIRILIEIDTNVQTATNFDTKYGKYIIDGFPSDPEFWSFLTASKQMPDYTIALIENREIDDELKEYYNTIQSSQKNHSERFTMANDPLIKEKLHLEPKPNTTYLDAKIIVNDVIKISIDSILETTNFVKDDPMDDPSSPSFNATVEKFKEDWDTVKLKIEEFDKCFIDVELEKKSDVQVVDEVLLKLRQGYMKLCEPNEEEGEVPEDEDERPKNLLKFNNPRILCDTNIFCPVAYYDHGVLWIGNPEFGLTLNNICYNFCKEEAMEVFMKDVVKYQSFNEPFKRLPPLRICVIGCIGSGRTTLSKLLAKELGLVHIDFAEAINELLLPKHFKKVGRRHENSFTDVPMDDEAVTEFQMDEGNENIFSDLMSNETEIRRMIYNYFERGAQIPPPLMEKLIKRLWFTDPFVDTGFILDGYPRLPLDIEDMVNSFCIPDLVIEIESSSEITQQRLAPKMFKTWKEQLLVEKNKARQKLVAQKADWVDFIAKKIVPKLIVEELLENMFFQTLDSEQDNITAVGSTIMEPHPLGLSTVDANLFISYNEIILEHPEPVDQSEWEKADEVREKIESRIESIYETDDENLQGLKDTLFEQRIKVLSITGTKSVEKVLRKTLSKLSNLRNRCESFFEQTFIVSTEMAEVLLREGICFISKFGRSCPVYVYENPDAVQSIYKLSKRKGKIYPIIHRAFIYFNGGPNAANKFRTNPLKYVHSNNISKFIEYPLRIGVTGHPKSGKTTLAVKLANIYGLICISKGKAVRHIIENMHWTELGRKMHSSAIFGDCINEDHIVKAIQTSAIDHRTNTYGFVLDGVPETASEAMELCKDGLYPNIVFDISSNIETILESSQLEVYYDILKYKPPYSRPFIQNRYEKLSENRYKLRDWIYNDYQNIYVLDGNQSMWQCLADATKVINKFIPKVHHYLTNVEHHVVQADMMCISNEIFNKRISCYKNFCPLCLTENIIRHSDYPVNKQGVVQYMNKFYWVCVDHMDDVLQNPEKYLLAEKVKLPEVPAVVKNVLMDLVYEKGICIVHYAEKLPSQVIVTGTNKHAASFKGKTYLFCSDKCLKKFMAKPHMYADITQIKNKKIFPPLSLNKLPNLGYLEQTVGNLITDACCAVNVLRPKYPGLDYDLSALLYIALYLKTHNPRMDKTVVSKYMKAIHVFEARCKMITHIGLVLRSMDNPFASYPVCCRERKHRVSIKGKSSSSGTIRKPSSIDLSSPASGSVIIFPQVL